jgi:phosphoribosylamine--glycine ligase
MKVLVVGGGGREHALCWKIRQSPLVTEVLCAPGNAGTAKVARNVAVAQADVEGLTALAARESVGLAVIGPEEPLVLGLADRLRARDVPCFGPAASAARLEGSKLFAKELLERHHIPTAGFRRFEHSGLAKAHLEALKTWPQVVKADGLAAGKGVFVCSSAREACAVVDQLMEQKLLGAAGARLIVEEFLAGEELSVMGITDGRAIAILEPVQDHKRVGDGDSGPNTGGMGAASPVPWVTKRLMRQIERSVLLPTLHALCIEELPFHGLLYAGLMVTDAGPRVLEYNCRFGDPECQAIVRRMRSDLVPLLLGAAKGELAELPPPEFDERACVGVVMAAEGYPAAPRKGDRIFGLEQAEELEDVVVFHGGTALEGPSRVVTSGGRVLCVTALGAGLEDARARAYAAVDRIRWSGAYCRRDIGARRAKPPEARLSTAEEPAG